MAVSVDIGRSVGAPLNLAHPPRTRPVGGPAGRSSGRALRICPAAATSLVVVASSRSGVSSGRPAGAVVSLVSVFSVVVGIGFGGPLVAAVSLVVICLFALALVAVASFGFNFAFGVGLGLFFARGQKKCGGEKSAGAKKARMRKNGREKRGGGKRGGGEVPPVGFE